MALTTAQIQALINNSPNNTKPALQAIFDALTTNQYTPVPLQGIQGLKGDTGLQGIQGLKGDTGLQGIQGLKGDTGLQGIQGLKGDTGLQGIQGLKGDTGLQGIQGLKGDTGLQGIQGLKGDTGLQGIQGLKGDTGLQGIQGLKGDTGLSFNTNTYFLYDQTNAIINTFNNQTLAYNHVKNVIGLNISLYAFKRHFITNLSMNLGTIFLSKIQ
jgi:hypothetical protein